MRVDRGRDHRRRKTGQKHRARLGFLWTASLLVFSSAAGMGMVWLNSQNTSTWLEYDEARKRNEILRADLSGERLKLLNKIRLADLNPRAKERLGMSHPSVDDIRLVHLDPSLDNSGTREPGIMERIVPAAQAQENRLIHGLSRERTVAGSPAEKENRP
jgi:hypothetical protein